MNALLDWNTAHEGIWRTRRHHQAGSVGGLERQNWQRNNVPLLTFSIFQDNDEHLLQKRLRRHIWHSKPAAGPSNTMTKTTILRPRTLTSSDADHHHTARDFFGARLSRCEATTIMK